jgi:hypothetical protein
MAVEDIFVPICRIPSHSCELWDLVDGGFAIAGRDVAVLAREPGWAQRWTATWKTAAGVVVCPVGDLGSVRFDGCLPVRRFSWRTGQRHRPGLQYLVSTGRHHGFESLAEQKVLLALDFAGAVSEVWSQPFRFRFLACEGWWEHTPDFLAWGRGGFVLIDVRPAGRVGPDDRVRFAAAAEVALACGWRYVVVLGWRRHVMSTLDTLSSQRRALNDRLGMQAQLMEAARHGPVPFGDLAAATSVPAVGRAHALHLLWHRRLSIDLGQPLSDRSLVSRAGR